MAKFVETRFCNAAAQAMSDVSKFSFLGPEIKAALLVDFRWVSSESDLKVLCDNCLAAFELFSLRDYRLCPGDATVYTNPFNPAGLAIKAAMVTSFSKMVVEKLDRWRDVGIAALALRQGLSDVEFQQVLTQHLSAITPCEVSLRDCFKHKMAVAFSRVKLLFKIDFLLLADARGGVGERCDRDYSAPTPADLWSLAVTYESPCRKFCRGHERLCGASKLCRGIFGNFGNDLLAFRSGELKRESLTNTFRSFRTAENKNALYL